MQYDCLDYGMNHDISHIPSHLMANVMFFSPIFLCCLRIQFSQPPWFVDIESLYLHNPMLHSSVTQFCLPDVLVIIPNTVTPAKHMSNRAQFGKCLLDDPCISMLYIFSVLQSALAPMFFGPGSCQARFIVPATQARTAACIFGAFVILLHPPNFSLKISLHLKVFHKVVYVGCCSPFFSTNFIIVVCPNCFLAAVYTILHCFL